jgi:hypothetical protein
MSVDSRLMIDFWLLLLSFRTEKTDIPSSYRLCGCMASLSNGRDGWPETFYCGKLAIFFLEKTSCSRILLCVYFVPGPSSRVHVVLPVSRGRYRVDRHCKATQNVVHGWESSMQLLFQITVDWKFRCGPESVLSVRLHVSPPGHHIFL